MEPITGKNIYFFVFMFRKGEAPNTTIYTNHTTHARTVSAGNLKSLGRDIIAEVPAASTLTLRVMSKPSDVLVEPSRTESLESDGYSDIILDGGGLELVIQDLDSTIDTSEEEIRSQFLYLITHGYGHAVHAQLCCMSVR